jgi:hypothetical protein
MGVGRWHIYIYILKHTYIYIYITIYIYIIHTILSHFAYSHPWLIPNRTRSRAVPMESPGTLKLALPSGNQTWLEFHEFPMYFNDVPSYKPSLMDDVSFKTSVYR